MKAKKGGEVSVSKFHRVFGKALGVALEMILPVEETLAVIGEYDLRGRPEFENRGSNFLRVFHPAIADGDMSQEGRRSGTIQFVPWVDGATALGYRLVLRYDPESLSPWIRLARFGEERIFQLGKFVRLDFLSMRSDGFVPVYIKAKIDQSKSIYLEISADGDDEKVIVKVRRVAKSKVPLYLAEATI